MEEVLNREGEALNRGGEAVSKDGPQGLRAPGAKARRDRNGCQQRNEDDHDHEHRGEATEDPAALARAA